MTIQEQYDNLEKTIRAYNPAADFAQIRAAFDYANKCHDGQKRKSGEPYIIHPLAVFHERGLLTLALEGDHLKLKLNPHQGKVDLNACPYLARLRDDPAGRN